MNGDDLRDRRQGDPAQESARRFNLVNEVLRSHRSGKLNQTGQPGGSDNDPCDVPVQNNTTNTISQFGILGLDAPFIDPTTAPDAYKSMGMAFKGVVPTIANHKGRFGIAQQPIAPGGIGTCRIAGASMVQISVGASTDTAADITDSDTTKLTSGDGSAQILMVANGSNSTGLQWCVVRLGGGGGLPKGQYQSMVYQMTTDRVAGFDFVHAHAMNG